MWMEIWDGPDDWLGMEAEGIQRESLRLSLRWELRGTVRPSGGFQAKTGLGSEIRVKT